MDRKIQPNTFWGWGFSAKDDADQQLIQACAAYRGRFGREATVVWVHPDRAKSLPQSQLVVVQHNDIPVNSFYFTVPVGAS